MRTFRLKSMILLAGFAGAASAQPPAPKNGDDKVQKVELALLPVPESNVKLSLAECLTIGANQQPAVRAAQASLRGSEAGYQALLNVGRAARLASADYEFRKQQGERGLIVGSADVEKALQENKYDIITLYYSYVYARQADQMAADIVIQLEQFYDIAKASAEVPGSTITQFDLYTMQDVIFEIKKLRIKARSGQSKALDALKEAMGVPLSYDFVPKDAELPIMGGSVTKEQVVELATGRRPEMAMAAAGVDAFRLEVCAQAAVKYRLKVPTLALGSDLHSRIIPVPHRNGEYRPGALAAEMPTTLVGKKDDRVARAKDILDRQETVFDKTRNLVSLEAANAYSVWLAASEHVRYAKLNFENAKIKADEAKTTAQNKNDYALAIRYSALKGKAQAEYIEAVFEQIKTLATLERVTSGGVKPAFPDQ